MAETRIRCPNPACQASFEAAEGGAGRAVLCPRCGSNSSDSGTMADATDQPPGEGPPGTMNLVEGFLFAGRYRILRRLRRGGMGVVYLVEDLRLGCQAALKLPMPGWSEDDEFLRRFDREARAMARLRHPNICRIHDVASHQGQPYFTMDYIEGNSLKDYLGRRESPTDPVKAARLVREIARTLQYAHEKGVVHRDLKPSNIMMSEGRPIVLDFGLARIDDPIDSLRTRTGDTMGTPAYLPPEQLRGQVQEVGPRSDVYSLGVIFFQLLTGRLPYEGSLWSILEQIRLARRPPAPSSLRPAIDPALDAICLGAMALQPEDRFASMRELAESIDRFLKSAPVPTPPDIGVNHPGPVANPLNAADRGRSKPARTPITRKKRALIGQKLVANAYWAAPTTIVLVALAALVGFEIYSRNPLPPAVPVVPVPVSEKPKPAKSFTSATTGMTFVLIEPGDFLMGSSGEQVDKLLAQIPEATIHWFKDEQPQHKVKITRPFYLARHEVTVGQFKQFVHATGYITDAEQDKSVQNWRGPGFIQGLDHPVACVSYNDAKAFIQWMNDRENQANRVYRLPTEAEWEYACRAGTTRLYGDSDDPETLVRVANVADATYKVSAPTEKAFILGNDGYACTAPVGSFKPNGWQLYDMIGNVSEWCDEWYAQGFYKSSPESNPHNQVETTYRVYRGGGWYGTGARTRPAYRYKGPPKYHDNYLGFRVAATQDQGSSDP